MRIDRLVSIIMILLEKERMGAHELAEMFEVSKRTIYRDIDSINMAGIPIRSTPGVSGGFEIMKQYKVDKKIFTTNDLSAILMGLSNMTTVVRGDEMVNTLAKVKSFIPEDKAKDIELKTNQIYIDMSPWMGNRNIQKYLEIIKVALQERQILEFDYTDRFGNNVKRQAEAYQLVLKNTHWYLHCYCLKRNDFRLFKVSRMSNLVLKTELYTPRLYEKPQLDFDHELTAIQIEIRIRIHMSIVDRVLEFCSFDHFTPDGKEHYFVDFPFIENDYHYNVLFSFGDKCECLGPTHVREAIKRRINDIAILYGIEVKLD